MIRWLGIFVLLVFLAGVGSPVHAKRENLVQNGSFEQGMDGWITFGSYRWVRGYCGKKALVLHGSTHSPYIDTEANKRYKIAFRYKGKRLRVADTPVPPSPRKWARIKREFVASSELTILAFEGVVTFDCVRVVLLN